MRKKTETKVSNYTNNAINVKRTPNINSMQHLTTENSGITRPVLVGQTLVQDELLVTEPQFQSLNISGKSFADATKTSDKDQEYEEADTCVISCEDQVGSNADIGVARVGSEPTDTTNEKIGLQQKTTSSKSFVVAVASHFWKAIY